MRSYGAGLLDTSSPFCVLKKIKRELIAHRYWVSSVLDLKAHSALRKQLRFTES